jgi:RimJ/RimL family protein N-acetyltransferase
MKFLSSYVKDNFVHLIDFKKRYLWIVSEAAISIGFFDFEIENINKGYFSFYLSPEYRGRGLGTILLHEALNLSEIRLVKVFEGGVEKDNFSSIRTLEKIGFKYIETDEDGMLMYQLSM